MTIDELLHRVWERDELADLDPAERRIALREVVGESHLHLVGDLADVIDGYGPLTAVMRDADVTDVLVNGPGEVWVERSGALAKTDLSFRDRDELLRLVERWAGEAGVQVDPSHPLVDARLPDGSRMHVVLPPVAPHGPLVSIRRFSREGLSLDDLVRSHTTTPEIAGRLDGYVRAALNIVVSGATGSGKTTLLNALLRCVPPTERVVLIEEVAELRPACAHQVSLLTKVPNVEGRGGVELAALTRAALRMRPDRIVVGEVRGPEAAIALQAMSTGHHGSLLTVHAGSARAALARLRDLGASAGWSEEASDGWVTGVVDVVVHLARREGRRVVAEVLETG